jgi:hypothetical protein
MQPTITGRVTHTSISIPSKPDVVRDRQPRARHPSRLRPTGGQKAQRSMELHVRLRPPRDQAGQRVERHLHRAMQRVFVHLVER